MLLVIDYVLKIFVQWRLQEYEKGNYTTVVIIYLLVNFQIVE